MQDLQTRTIYVCSTNNFTLMLCSQSLQLDHYGGGPPSPPPSPGGGPP